VEHFVVHDGRFRYVWQENARQAAARNHGLRLARGEYVAFLDHDDLWEATFLEETVAYLDEHPEAGMVFTYGYYLNGSERSGTVCLPEPENPDIFGQIIRSCVFTPVNALLRRERVAEIGAFRLEGVPAEDYDLWLRFGRRWEMHVLKIPLANYRFHGNNDTNFRGMQQAEATCRALEDLAKDENVSSHYRAIAMRRLQSVGKDRARVFLRNFAVFPAATWFKRVMWIVAALRHSPKTVWEERWVFRLLLRQLIRRSATSCLG
jgi:hypothetical protein